MTKAIPVIRLAAPTDAQLLAELGARTFSEAFAVDNKPEDMAAYLAAAFSPEQQAVELADPSSIFLISEIERRAVGYAQLRAGEAPEVVRVEKPIELARLYVSREWHGLGVGEALMRACIDEAQRAGYQTIWLGVWERNSRARAFYRKWDFREVGEHIFQLGADPQKDILMKRSI
jgi:ribosomal protein S18 acetylase RimI-like enzyme